MINQHKFRNLVGLYEKALPTDMSWQERLIITKSLGFDFLEISVDESDDKRARLDWSDNEISQLRSLSLQHQLPIQSMCLSAHRRFPFGSLEKSTREQAAIHMEKAICLAHKLGIRVIQLAGYDVYYEPACDKTHNYFVTGMQYCAKLAEQAGIMLAVEIMDTPYLNSLSKFEILKREVPSPYFMAYPDVGNINGWNYDVCTELNLARDHIVQIHLKDTYSVKKDDQGQFRDLVIGEGEVNFSAIFNQLTRMNYVAPFVIEMWAKDNNWQQNIKQAQEYLYNASKQSTINLFSHLFDK